MEFERYLKYIFIFILVTIVADGYGLFLGTIFNPINGTFIGAVITCYLLAFCGFLAFFNHMPKFMYYISFSSVMRYGLEGTTLAVLGNNRQDFSCPDTELYCHYK